MRLNSSRKLPLSLVLLVVLGSVLLLALGALACSDFNRNEQNPLSGFGVGSGLKIVASVFAPYDFSRAIVGEEAEVRMLIPPGAETHSFEPSPADIIMLNTADVFIYVGGESDAWLEKIINSLDNPDLTLIRLIDIVEPLEEVALEGMDLSGAEAGATHDHDHDGDATHDHAEDADLDEHVWTSLRNAQIIISALADAFSKLDPEHAEVFADNAASLNKELDALDQRIVKIVSNAKRTTVVFGDRFPFRYFAEDYGLTCYAAFPGCSTAVDTNPATIAFLIDTVREQGIPVVFYIELSDQRIARQVAEETGAETLLFHSAHNISKDDMNAGATYLSLMRSNADNLEVALN